MRCLRSMRHFQANFIDLWRFFYDALSP